jgi:NodT family efflux transporter outer membrane factor (OMF) lipoprotein
MRQQTKRSVAVAITLLCLPLTACFKPGPRLTTPPAPAIDATPEWTTEQPSGVAYKAADDELLTHWWSTLNDPALTSLEERAVAGNLDLRVALSRLRQARAQRNITKSGLLPTVTGNVSSGVTRSGNQDAPATVTQLYSAGFDASWEPDVFGGTRLSVDAAEADIAAAQENLRDVLVSLTAEVALNYIDVRTYQARLAIVRENLASQRETHEIAVSRYESGLATELDVQQSRTTLASSEAQIPSLEASLSQAMNRLAVLLGERPGTLNAELDSPAAVPVVPAEVAVGLPADLLRRRPDIRSLEQQVLAQTARLGVATADLYPSFSLSGSFGLNSRMIGDLLSPGALVTSVTGGITHTIFDRRRIRESIKVQDELLDQALTQYESGVLVAIEDVENALENFAKEQVRRKSLADAVDAAGEAVFLSRNLYGAGMNDFLEVLDAQRSLLTYQDQLQQSDSTITTELISLYKALGGGWDPAVAY